jgi:hypothetical protein
MYRALPRLHQSKGPWLLDLGTGEVERQDIKHNYLITSVLSVTKDQAMHYKGLRLPRGGHLEAHRMVKKTAQGHTATR